MRPCLQNERLDLIGSCLAIGAGFRRTGLASAERSAAMRIASACVLNVTCYPLRMEFIKTALMTLMAVIALAVFAMFWLLADTRVFVAVVSVMALTLFLQYRQPTSPLT